MNVYVYRAAFLCEMCGKLERHNIASNESDRVPADPTDESSYDSNDYPKGPFADGGGEADVPQHCDHCNEFLENPLTADGLRFVRGAIARLEFHNKPVNGPAAQWRDFYLELEHAFRRDYCGQSQKGI